MLNVSWVLVLVTPTLLWSTAHCPASQIGNNGFVVKYPVVYGVPAHIAGGYCHRVFETQMLPYFAQFPVVELDRTSASFWSSFLYRSNLARYGDQWDWQARRSCAAFAVGLQNGWIVPRSRFAAIHSRERLVESGETSKRLPDPVKLTNPFCDEKLPGSINHQEESLPRLEGNATFRVMTSASVMPLRVTNQFVP